MEEASSGLQRRSKVTTLDEAISRFVPQDCESLIMGGMHLHNIPIALMRELIRQRKGRQIGTLLAGPAASLGADLLIGAGLVREAIVSYIGFEHFGLAPAFKRAADDKKLAIKDVDAFSLLESVRAGGAGMPFVGLPAGLERGDMAELGAGFYREVTDPFSGETALVVPGIKPQVALIHCQEADQYGNGIFRGSQFADRVMALAADTVILQVERLIDHSAVLKAPTTVGVPGFRVAAVVQVNFGCHPMSSHRYYNYDDVHIATYRRMAATEEGFWDYVRRYIDEPTSQDNYMDRLQEEEWNR